MPAPDSVAAELMLMGRITTASNAILPGSVGGGAAVVGLSRRLPGAPRSGCLPGLGGAGLEHRAAHLAVDGPFCEGMVQLWQETDPEQTAVDRVPADDVPDTGWKQVLEGEDQNGRSIALIHEDTAALRRMAVFDVLVNNADRKGDHILAMGDGLRYGVDHGLTFHSDHKLRTVLWGWIGEALSADELDGVDRVLSGLEGELGWELAKLLTTEEIASTAARCARLRSAGAFSGSEWRDACGALAVVLRKSVNLGA